MTREDNINYYKKYCIMFEIKFSTIYTYMPTVFCIKQTLILKCFCLDM